MDLNNTPGVGEPDNSASAGTLDLVDNVPSIEDAPSIVDESTIVSDTPAADDSAEDSAEISEDIKAEMESVIEAQANDSALVKKLRDLVKVKYDDFSSKVPQSDLSESQQLAEELITGLFEYDVESGPTTRSFAEKLAAKDMSVATQALSDLSNVQVDPDTGWTLGHQFLESIGLDPYKIEELRQFSRGELAAPESYGIIPVHPSVPPEFAEAYKSLDQVTRTDVDIYLDSENEGQKLAAMRTLRNQKTVMDTDRMREEGQKQFQAQFTNEVTTALETDLETTYTGLMTSLKSNPAYVNVAVSADKNIDTMVKDTVIANLNALGDPRSVLAKQAVAQFESRGVQVDLPKITSLMQTIEDTTKIAITAEKQGKLQGRDYSTQIQDALSRKSQAMASLTALGNKYFSQVLANLTGSQVNSPNPKGSIPKLEGTPAAPTSNTSGVKTFKELDAEILNIAKGLAATQ